MTTFPDPHATLPETGTSAPSASSIEPNPISISPTSASNIINVTPVSSTAVRSNEFHLITINISAQALLKLTTTNYMSWKLQFQTLFFGYDLVGYIDGSKPCPPTTLIVNNITSPNPAYSVWFRQDQLILNALIGSLSPTIVSFVARAKTSMEAWNILANTYAKPSRGRIKQIKSLLKNSTKGTQNITDFLHSVKARADELALLGAPVDDEDLTERILDELDDDYKELVRAVQARDTPISFDELHEKLLTFEASSLNNKKASASLPATANPTHRSNNSWRPRNSNFSSWHPQSSTTTGWRPSPNSAARSNSAHSPGAPHRGHLSFPRPYLGKCQMCGIQGHSARRCSSFQMVPVPSHGSGSNSPAAHSPPPWQPRAHFTTNVPSNNPAWLMDSGASHHVTADLGNLSLHAPYSGSDDVMIGDSTGLSITHSGSASLHTRNNSFILDNVLCVPDMKKNLVSISQFCNANNVSVEFLSSCFHVKDLRTGPILLKGTTKDGVYEWPTDKSTSSPVLAFSSTRTTSSNWHHRLGHPAYPVLKLIVSKFNLDLSSSILKDLKKSDVKDTFIRFRAIVENFFKHKIVSLYSDNGGEYLSLKEFLGTNGISHLTTPPHTPEHNGYSERRHRHIVETGLTLLSHASLPLHFWSHVFAAAVYLINRMPTATLTHSSPFEMIFGTVPNYSKLKIFGCLCYPWLRPYSSHKLSPRSSPCVFLGYSLSQSAYICYDPSTTRIYVSCHVKFVESVFPYTSINVTLPRPSTTTVNSWVPPVVTVPIPETSPLPAAAASSPTSIVNVAPHLEPISSAAVDTPFASGHVSSPGTATATATAPPCTTSLPLLPSSPQPASTTSTPQPPIRHSMTTRAKNNIHKPVQKLNLHTKLSPSVDFEPTTVAQALKDPNWRQAMSNKCNALVKNGTWELVQPDSSTNIVGCKWIFRIKRKSDGSIDRFKARLMANRD
ncbi:hypothetical protein Q3G72_023368 [Acer saccharum]|nr:hypothetical protein Q3G72_023368 [Acer saccharum]